jgi:hypothetical protein
LPQVVGARGPPPRLAHRLNRWKQQTGQRRPTIQPG